MFARKTEDPGKLPGFNSKGPDGRKKRKNPRRRRQAREALEVENARLADGGGLGNGRDVVQEAFKDMDGGKVMPQDRRMLWIWTLRWR